MSFILLRTALFSRIHTSKSLVGHNINLQHAHRLEILIRLIIQGFMMSFLSRKDQFLQYFHRESSNQVKSKDKGNDICPPSYDKATQSERIADDENPTSISPTWAADIKSALSFEEFCEYFAANTINASTPEHLIGPGKELQVDVVEGVLPQLYPGVVRAQMGDLHIRFHLDSTGLCGSQKPAPSSFRVYVLWISWYPSGERPGFLRWLQNVRKLSPNSVIVIVRDTLGKDEALEAAYAKLATVYVSGKVDSLGEETEKLYKVLARAAMLNVLSTQSSNSNKGSGGKQTGKGDSTVRKYTYKGKTEFHKL